MTSPKPSLDDLRIERRPERDSPPVGVYVAVCAGLLLAAAAWFFWHHGGHAVEVHTALVRAVASTGPRTVLNASGYVTARRQATVSSKATGKMIEIRFEEGDKVNEGQVLARLDDSNVKNNLDVTQAELDSARLSLEETRAQLKQADNEFTRTAALAKKEISSASDLDRAESDAMTLRARLARQQEDVVTAERQVSLWKQQMDDMVIRAPFSGVVTTKDAQPGEMVSPVSAGGGFTRTGICTVVDMNSREIEIDVNESYINRVQPAQPVEATLDAYPNWKIPCHVIAIIPTADRQKATVKVRVGFDNLDPRILPDMSVKVAFQESADAPASPAPRALVPKGALRESGRDTIAWVVNNNHAERRALTVLDSQGDDAVAGNGISAGEKVILDPPAELTDGAAVKEKNP
ncbi:MAG: efflux RND transporter periplasmic adaptor subunit [Verrucomicrobiota bacterium]|jgi:RND family efflux transporter MFP subunit